MLHIIFGLFAIALGIWGVFDEWYYVVDVMKGGSSIFFTLVGLLAIFAGLTGHHIQMEEPQTSGK
jgi:hypothetical protein